MTKRVRPLVAAVLLVVLTGCQAPMAETDHNVSIAVEGGNLSVSPGQVFVGVRSVMDVETEPPRRVTVLQNASALGANASDVPRFYRLLNLTHRRGLNGTAFERMENGVTSSTGFIYILPSPDGDPASTEWVLAHEFAHYVNLKLGRVTALTGTIEQSTDGRYVRRAVREGATVLATDAYLARHGGPVGPTAPMYERLLEAVPSGEIGRYGFSRYVFGYRYVSARVADPAALGEVYERPPNTSEQVIHAVPPGREPAAALNVTVTESERWSVGGTDRMGEAFLRYVLENGVEPARAAEAAAGWGVDRLYYLRPDGGGPSSYAWVIRWDDATNATAFERTLRAYLTDRGERTGGRYRLPNATAAVRTPTDRTTVLLLGDRAIATGTDVTDAGPGRIRLLLPEGAAPDRAPSIDRDGLR